MEITENQLLTLLEMELHIPKHMNQYVQVLQITKEEETNVIKVEYVALAHMMYPINDHDLYINLTFEIDVAGDWGSYMKLVKIA